MTPEKVREALNECAQVVRDAGADKPERLDEKGRAMKLIEGGGRQRWLNHVLFLAEDGHSLLDQARTEKAHRHLGFREPSGASDLFRSPTSWR